MRDGRRCSAAVAYLRPALARKGRLTVATGALATRVLLEGARAIGIEYLHRGRPVTARAEGEVMPDLIGANINAAVIMIAEKAADLLRGRPPLAPAAV